MEVTNFVINLASDNWAGLAPCVLSAINAASRGHYGAYGKDDLSSLLGKRLCSLFGTDKLSWCIVSNGTAANVVAISSVLNPWEAVIASQNAHLVWDECGALERFSGNRILEVETVHGKISCKSLEQALNVQREIHQVRPRVISLTQCSERGTVYSWQELGKIRELAQNNGLLVHIDGARIANALREEGELRELAKTCDLLSFGFMKNGGAFGELVVSFAPDLHQRLAYTQKQAMQLNSKQFLCAAQILSLLDNQNYLSLAHHANNMCRKLATGLIKRGFIPRVPVEANAVFVSLPADLRDKLSEDFKFYTWDHNLNEVRLMCSFATQEQEIDQFLACLA